MNRFMVLLVGLCLSLAGTAQAQTAGMMSFQALIKDGAGVPLDGPQDLLFEIIDGAIPTPNVLASFTQLGVPAKQGVVSTKYGPVSPGLFNGAPTLWLRVTVTSQNPDLSLSPLEIISPPAVAEQLNRPGTGLAAIQIDPNGRVGIGTSSPGSALEIMAPGSADEGIRIRNAAHPDRFFYAGVSSYGSIRLGSSSVDPGYNHLVLQDYAGNVGIGLPANPAQKLHVRGNTAIEGAIGIGTTTPGVPLHIVSGGDALIRLESPGGPAFDQHIHFKDSESNWYVGNRWTQPNNSFGIGRTAEKNDVVIRHDNGNVGIGIATPQRLLSLAKSEEDTGIQISNTSPGGRAWNILVTGLGSALPAGHLRIYDEAAATDRLVISMDGNVGIGTPIPSERLHVTGNICATGTIGACSDARFKRELGELTEALETVEKLRAVRFSWKRNEFPERKFDESPQIGFIAQEVQEVVPEVVHQGSDGYFSVDYGRLSTLLTRAVQEMHATQLADSAALRAENGLLKARVEKQQQAIDEYSIRLKRLDELEARLAHLEKLLEKSEAGEAP